MCIFLQEGHTAFATKEEADQEVLDILDLYRCIISTEPGRSIFDIHRGPK